MPRDTPSDSPYAVVNIAVVGGVAPVLATIMPKQSSVSWSNPEASRCWANSARLTSILAREGHISTPVALALADRT
jgi:hypothetical protein